MTQQDGIDAFATMTDHSTLVIQRWLPGPVDRVWRYLTDSDLRRKWLAAGEMDFAPGAPLELVWRNDSLSDPDDLRPADFAKEQRMQSRIVAVDPMRMLVIAWGKGDVSFALKEKCDRVLLTVTHRGLDDRNMRRETAPGWHALFAPKAQAMAIGEGLAWRCSPWHHAEAPANSFVGGRNHRLPCLGTCGCDDRVGRQHDRRANRRVNVRRWD